MINYEKLAYFLKRNKTVESFSRFMAYPLFFYWKLKEDIAERKRKNGYVDPRYIWIKDYENKYAGQRCFVVATGPSLTFSDLDMIKDEYSFSMNAAILALDKTEWRPDFYSIGDGNVFGNIKEAVLQHTELNIVVDSAIKTSHNLPDWIKAYPMHLLDHRLLNWKRNPQWTFSDDCYGALYHVPSIVFYVLQFACYMGFKEIYLLGCDCNYNLPSAHFIEYHDDNLLPAKSFGNELITTHEAFKKYADSRGIKVINCTRGGMLEVYPRMQLEEVLSKK